MAFLDVATAFGYDLANKKLLETNPSIKISESKSLRVASGVGLAWYSPLGRICFYYGIPLKKKKFDLQQRFIVSMGTVF